MKLRKKYNSNKGFTLVEVLLVLALIATLATLGVSYGRENYLRVRFKEERELALAVLSQARSLAMANVEEKVGWGVKVENDKYILFPGEVYLEDNSLNIVFPGNKKILKTGLDLVVFESLSGRAIFNLKDLFLDFNILNSVISINEEGRISWTK